MGSCAATTAVRRGGTSGYLPRGVDPSRPIEFARERAAPRLVRARGWRYAPSRAGSPRCSHPAVAKSSGVPSALEAWERVGCRRFAPPSAQQPTCRDVGGTIARLLLYSRRTQANFVSCVLAL